MDERMPGGMPVLDRVCTHCQGEGKEGFGLTCLACNGVGREPTEAGKEILRFLTIHLRVRLEVASE
jgi:DnaJ-class molecular chaperone